MKHLVQTRLSKVHLRYLSDTKWSRDPSLLTKLQFLQVLGDLEKVRWSYHYSEFFSEHVFSMEGVVSVFFNGRTTHFPIEVKRFHSIKHVAVNQAILAYLKQRAFIISSTNGRKV